MSSVQPCKYCNVKLSFPQNAVFIQCPKCSNTINLRDNSTHYINCKSCKVLLSYPPDAAVIKCPQCSLQMDIPAQGPAAASPAPAPSGASASAAGGTPVKATPTGLSAPLAFGLTPKPASPFGGGGGGLGPTTSPAPFGQAAMFGSNMASTGFAEAPSNMPTFGTPSKATAPNPFLEAAQNQPTFGSPAANPFLEAAQNQPAFGASPAKPTFGFGTSSPAPAQPFGFGVEAAPNQPTPGLASQFGQMSLGASPAGKTVAGFGSASPVKTPAMFGSAIPVKTADDFSVGITTAKASQPPPNVDSFVTVDASRDVVLSWLWANRLFEYLHLFVNNAIDGEALSRMGEKDLDDLGITNADHRARILALIKNVKTSASAPVVPAFGKAGQPTRVEQFKSFACAREHPIARKDRSEEEAKAVLIAANMVSQDEAMTVDIEKFKAFLATKPDAQVLQDVLSAFPFKALDNLSANWDKIKEETKDLAVPNPENLPINESMKRSEFAARRWRLHRLTREMQIMQAQDKENLLKGQVKQITPSDWKTNNDIYAPSESIPFHTCALRHDKEKDNTDQPDFKIGRMSAWIPMYDVTSGKLHPSFAKRDLTGLEKEHPLILGGKSQKDAYQLPARFWREDEVEYVNAAGQIVAPPTSGGVPHGITRRRKAGVNALPEEEKTASAMVNIERFRRNWNAFCSGRADALPLGPNCMAMGGAVLNCLLPLPDDLMAMHREVEKYDTALQNYFPRVISDLIYSYAGSRRQAEQRLEEALAEYYTKQFKGSDVDLFITATREGQVVQKTANSFTVDELSEGRVVKPAYESLKEVSQSIMQKLTPARLPYVVRSPTAVTLCGIAFPSKGKYTVPKTKAGAARDGAPEDESAHQQRMKDAYLGQRNIQLVPVGNRSRQDVLMDFDIDSVTFGYDGVQVYALPRARRAINTMTNFVDPFVLRFNRTRTRLVKYHARGFSLLLFESCRHFPRCDVLADSIVRGLWLDLKEFISREFYRVKDPKSWVQVTKKKRFGLGLTSQTQDDLALVAYSTPPAEQQLKDRDIKPTDPDDEDAFYHGDLQRYFECFPANVLQMRDRLKYFEERSRARAVERGLGHQYVCPFVHDFTDEKNIWRNRPRISRNRFGPTGAETTSDLDEQKATSVVTEEDALLVPDPDVKDADDKKDAAGRALPATLAVGAAKKVAKKKKSDDDDEDGDGEDDDGADDKPTPAGPTATPTTDTFPTVKNLLDKPLPCLSSASLTRRIVVGADANRVDHPCYVCGQPVCGEYCDMLCKRCVDKNKEASARYKQQDLNGKFALVTGIRTGSGYSAALTLLRSGATVVGLTRFPEITREKFLKESDSGDWSDHLFLYAMDLRHTHMLRSFLHFFRLRFTRLDIFINAAYVMQHRPPAYYSQLVARERELVNAALAKNAAPEPDTTEDAKEKEDNENTRLAAISAQIGIVPGEEEDVTPGPAAPAPGGFGRFKTPKFKAMAMGSAKKTAAAPDTTSIDQKDLAKFNKFDRTNPSFYPTTAPPRHIGSGPQPAAPKKPAPGGFGGGGFGGGGFGGGFGAKAAKVAAPARPAFGFGGSTASAGAPLAASLFGSTPAPAPAAPAPAVPAPEVVKPGTLDAIRQSLGINSPVAALETYKIALQAATASLASISATSQAHLAEVEKRVAVLRNLAQAGTAQDSAQLAAAINAAMQPIATPGAAAPSSASAASASEQQPSAPVGPVQYLNHVFNGFKQVYSREDPSFLTPHWAADATQVRVTSEDAVVSTVAQHAAVGLGAIDFVSGRPLDTRTRQTLNCSLLTTDPSELLELQLVNNIAPSTILQDLRKLLQTYEANEPRCVVLVTPSSGAPTKSAFSNSSLPPSMPSIPGAAGALSMMDAYDRVSGPRNDRLAMVQNMLYSLTRAAARNFSGNGCAVVCVEPGWIQDTRPLQSFPLWKDTGRSSNGHGHKPPRPVRVPLNADDAAARVVQPIFDHYESVKAAAVAPAPAPQPAMRFGGFASAPAAAAPPKPKRTGVLMKNFQEAAWPLA